MWGIPVVVVILLVVVLKLACNSTAPTSATDVVGQWTNPFNNHRIVFQAGNTFVENFGDAAQTNGTWKYERPQMTLTEEGKAPRIYTLSTKYDETAQRITLIRLTDAKGTVEAFVGKADNAFQGNQ